MRLNSIYLNFGGNAEEVFLFYKSVLKREFDSLVRFKDMPMPGVTLSEADANKILCGTFRTRTVGAFIDRPAGKLNTSGIPCCPLRIACIDVSPAYRPFFGKAAIIRPCRGRNQ